MNLSKILSNSIFSINDINIINSFVNGIGNIKNISYRKSRSSYNLIIEDNAFSYYYFIKGHENKTLILVTYNIKTKIYVEHHYINGFIPIISYKQINGESNGTGTGERILKNKTYSSLIYFDNDIQMYLLYPDGKITKKISICINYQHYISDNNNISYAQSIYHFEIETKKYSIINENIDYYKSFKIPFKIIDGQVKTKWSVDLGESFLDCVDIKQLLKSPYGLQSQCRDFLELFKMMEI